MEANVLQQIRSCNQFLMYTVPNSVLFLGRPGVGKTTVIREMARILSDDLKKRVVWSTSILGPINRICNILVVQEGLFLKNNIS